MKEIQQIIDDKNLDNVSGGVIIITTSPNNEYTADENEEADNQRVLSFIVSNSSNYNDQK